MPGRSVLSTPVLGTRSGSDSTHAQALENADHPSRATDSHCSTLGTICSWHWYTFPDRRLDQAPTYGSQVVCIVTAIPSPYRRLNRTGRPRDPPQYNAWMMHILWIWFWPAASSNRPRFVKLTTAACISKLLLSQIFPEQTGGNWTCPCAEDNHLLRVAPAGGTDLTRSNHPKQRGPCGRKHAFCGVIPPAKCLNNSGCGYTLQMNYGVNGMLTTSPTIGYISSRTTDTTITFLSN